METVGEARLPEPEKNGGTGMDVRVITLRYQEGLQGFPEEALRRIVNGYVPSASQREPARDGHGGGTTRRRGGAEGERWIRMN